MTITPPHNQLRLSNIELLRIVAMLMILVLHVQVDGIESTYDDTIDINHFTSFLFEAISIVGVNLFILISGYFGIHLRRRSVANILFQIYFFGLLGLIGWMAIQGTYAVDTRYFIKAILPVSQTVWFIPSYVMLMLLSPVLNAFCEKYDVKKIAQLTIAVYALSYFWTNIMQGTISGFGGYNWGWFVLLYLTGRIIRRYTDTHTYKKRYFLAGYVVATLAIVGIAFLQNRIPIGKSLLWSYDFPLVYISSISLFLCFVKLDIGYVKWINWIAASAFAVLLLHVAPFAQYVNVNRYLHDNYSGISYVMLTGAVVIGYFMAAVLIDQLRLFLFRKIVKK